MRALLNTLGASVWGLIAIILAEAVATLGYRLTLNHPADLGSYSQAPLSIQSTPPGASAPPAASTWAGATAGSPTRAVGDTRPRPLAHATPGLPHEWTEPPVEQSATGPADTPLIGHFIRPPEVVSTRSQAISRVIANQMSAAQQDLRAQRWADAIKNLEAAESTPGLTPFDREKIHYFKGFAYLKSNDMRAGQEELEQAAATGAAPPEDAALFSKLLFQIAAATGQHQKTIDYGAQLVDSGTATNETLLLIAQNYYQLKDCRNAVIWSDKGIAAARAARETPKENFFLFKLQCASDGQDNSAMDPVLVDLIKLNNKSMYWNSLLRIDRQAEREDRSLLMIYRIMYQTQSMKEDTDYIEMAQLLGDAALPGEASAVLSRSMSNGTVKDEHRERVQRLLSSLQSRADADEASLPQLESEAARDPAGEISVRLGELYYGAGQYQRAADAIMDGLQRGGVRSLQEAYVYLGLAQVRLNDYAGARDAFAMLARVPSVNPRVLKLWQLYAGTLREPASAPAVSSSIAAPSRPPALERSDGAVPPAPTSLWVEGTHYERVRLAHPTALAPGKVRVTEFFSYACPACYSFEPDMRRLVESLPPNAVVDYVAASWSRGWPTFQLGYATAHRLGVADVARSALFDAVWKGNGELAFFEEGTGFPRAAALTIEDIARFYDAQGLAPAAKFLQMSKSFAVEQECRIGDELVKDYGIDRVPAIVVNGKYRLYVQGAESPDRLIELVNYLVKKETAAADAS